MKAQHPESKHPFGLPGGIPAQPPRAAVRSAPGVKRLQKTEREQKQLPVLTVHELCPWGKSSKLDRSQRQKLEVGPLRSAGLRAQGVGGRWGSI
jgi:hypothetical protein